MRSFAALVLPVAITAAARVPIAGQETPVDQGWSYMPDKTADWYKDNGKPLPEIAQILNTVQEGQSYIVKLDCLGCPFRVRNIGEVYETWQEPAQDNSLLLNFTIDRSKASLLLNGERVAPFANLPLPISAFQTPANLSADIMDKMASQHMLDSSWTLGTKYGQFELQYEHTLLATEQPGEEWVQFDVTGVHRRGINPGSASLDKEGQKMVQILLRQEISENSQSLSIKDVQVMERKDRAQPLRMKCGKLAMVQTVYNPLEWDYYGQFGTLSRLWHLVWWKSLNFLDRNAPLLIVLLIIFCGSRVVRWNVRRQQERARAQVMDDAEVALLENEFDDAPLDYTNTQEEDKEEKEDGQ